VGMWVLLRRDIIQRRSISNCSGVTGGPVLLGGIRSSSSWLVVRLINSLFSCAARTRPIAPDLRLHGNFVQRSA